jgi:hypothetical protein
MVWVLGVPGNQLNGSLAPWAARSGCLPPDASRRGRFETEWLTRPANLAALADLMPLALRRPSSGYCFYLLPD